MRVSLWVSCAALRTEGSIKLIPLEWYRITSYNVCYTKLLRTVFTLKLGCSRLEITGVNCGGYDDGVEFIGVCDIDKNDDSVEVIVTTGSLYRHTNIYEYKDEKSYNFV